MANFQIKNIPIYTSICMEKYPVLLIIKNKLIFLYLAIAVLLFLIYLNVFATSTSFIGKNYINNFGTNTNKLILTKNTTILAAVKKTVKTGKIESNMEIKGWEKHKSLDLHDYIQDDIKSFKMLPKSLCKSKKFLVNFVTTSPKYFSKRKAVRETWGSQNKSLIDTYFVVGTTSDAITQQKLITENKKYNDIIQEDFLDTYQNLTLKTVTILKVVDKFCANGAAKYIFKVDDDVYVNTKLLVEYLLKNKKENFLAGRLFKNVEPIRDPKDKWYVPYYLYGQRTFPDYLAGAGYVMSSNVARILYKTAFDTPLFHIEDVYATGICAKKAGIGHINELKFTSFKAHYKPCQMRVLFTMHYQTPTNLRKLHKLVNTKGGWENCPMPID